MTAKPNEPSDGKEEHLKKHESTHQKLDAILNSEQHKEIDHLKNKLNESEKKALEHWDRILRMQAEIENTHRRSQRDVENAHKFALERFTSDLLPVIDNLERTITVASDTGVDAPSIIEGVNLTLQMFYDVLAKANIQQIDPLNEAFDPTFHQAISTLEDPNLKTGTVVNVLQKGYLLNGRLIRPAMVVVVK